MAAKPWICYPQEVKRREDYFGRKQVLDDLTFDFQSCIIFGERKIGKTSTVNMLKLWSNENGVLADDLLHRDTAQGLGVYIANLLSLKLLGVGLAQTNLFSRFPLDQPAIFEINFQCLVDELFSRKPEARVILILEEWDSLLHNATSENRHDLRKLFEQLIVSRPAQPPLKIVLTMNKEPKDFYVESKTPFEFSCKNVRLYPFPQTEDHQFLKWLMQGRFQLDERAYEFFYRENGGHVFFTKSTLDNIFELFAEEPQGASLNSSHIEGALKRSLERNSGTDFTLQNIWDAHFTPVEREIMEKCTDGLSGDQVQVFSEESSRALDGLVGRDYVVWDAKREAWIMRYGIMVRWRNNRTNYRQYAKKPEGTNGHSDPKPALRTVNGSTRVESYSLEALPILSVDTRKMEALLGKSRLMLQPKEYLVLACLTMHCGQVVSREMISAECWPEYEQGITPAMIDTALSGIRTHIRVALSQLLPKDSYTEIDLRQAINKYIETKPKFGFEANPKLVKLIDQ